MRVKCFFKKHEHMICVVRHIFKISFFPIIVIIKSSSWSLLNIYPINHVSFVTLHILGSRHYDFRKIAFEHENLDFKHALCLETEVIDTSLNTVMYIFI